MLLLALLCDLKIQNVAEGSIIFLLGWSEDMDATRESSLIVVGNRAGLSNDEIAHILEVMRFIVFLKGWDVNIQEMCPRACCRK